MERIKQNVRKSIKKGISRRTTVLLALLVLLAASSYANYRMSTSVGALQTDLPVLRILGSAPAPEPTKAPVQPQMENSFSAYREQRSASRAQEIRMLDEMIGDNRGSGASAEEARGQKLALVRSMEQETALEGLLKAKGFEDALVSSRPGSVSVVIKRESLTEAEAVQIMELAMRETGEEARNIKIIPTR
ncbi:MAG: SpoIIIAH-like family protein [Clostridia bacterium]|nr:SpoIIIAH-like family protein [Clostridia bacterium]